MKKILSILLTVCVLLGMLFSVPVSAAEGWAANATFSEGSAGLYTKDGDTVTIDIDHDSSCYQMVDMYVPYESPYATGNSANVIDVSWTMSADVPGSYADIVVYTGTLKTTIRFQNAGNDVLYVKNAENGLVLAEFSDTPVVRTYRVAGREDNFHLFIDGAYAGKLGQATVAAADYTHKLHFKIHSYGSTYPSLDTSMNFVITDVTGDPTGENSNEANTTAEEIIPALNEAAAIAYGEGWDEIKTLFTVTYKNFFALKTGGDAAIYTQSELYKRMTGITYASLDDILTAFDNAVTAQKQADKYVANAVLTKAANGDNSKIEDGTLIFDLSPIGSVFANQVDLPVVNLINLDISFDVQFAQPFAGNDDLYFEINADHGRFYFIINSWRLRDRVNGKDYDFAAGIDNRDKHSFRFVINWAQDSGEGSFHEQLQVFIDGKYFASIPAGARSGGNKTRFSQYCNGTNPVLNYVSNFKDNTATDLVLDNDNTANVIFHEALNNARLIWAAYDADNKMISHAISDGITTPKAYSIRRLSAPATFNAAGAAKVKIMLWKDIDTTFAPLSASVAR